MVVENTVVKEEVEKKDTKRDNFAADTQAMHKASQDKGKTQMAKEKIETVEQVRRKGKVKVRKGSLALVKTSFA